MLDNSVCIVAGGGQGLGEAAARNLGEQGARIVVNDLGTDLGGEGASKEPAQTTADAIEDAGGEAIAHFGDITDLEYTEELIADTVDAYGRVDSVVNFAGVLRDNMVHKMSGDEWDAVVAVHLRGHFAQLRSASGHWHEQAEAAGGELDEQRSFLCVSSEAALGNIGQSNYGSAKAGILGLMRTGARELERINVRVNALMPRAFTRMVEDIPEEIRPDEDEVPSPEEIAPIVSFFASDAATDVTGTTVRMTGDEVALMTEPAFEQVAVNEDGWSAEGLAKHFTQIFDGDLSKTEVKF